MKNLTKQEIQNMKKHQRKVEQRLLTIKQDPLAELFFPSTLVTKRKLDQLPAWNLPTPSTVIVNAAKTPISMVCGAARAAISIQMSTLTLEFLNTSINDDILYHLHVNDINSYRYSSYLSMKNPYYPKPSPGALELGRAISDMVVSGYRKSGYKDYHTSKHVTRPRLIIGCGARIGGVLETVMPYWGLTDSFEIEIAVTRNINVGDYVYLAFGLAEQGKSGHLPTRSFGAHAYAPVFDWRDDGALEVMCPQSYVVNVPVLMRLEVEF